MIVGKQKLAKKYARAFLRVFHKECTPPCLANLQLFSHIITQNTILQACLSLPSINEAEKEVLIDRIIQHFSLCPEIKNLILTLVSHHRTQLLGAVVKKIIFLAKQEQHEKDFMVTSSRMLTKTEQEIIEQFILKNVDPPITTTFTCDKTLISGIRIKGDTLFWERSVTKHLNDVKQAILRQEVS